MGISFSLRGQTDTSFNYIDKKLDNCLSDTAGVMGQNYCLHTAIEDWTKEMNKTLTLLSDILSPEQKQKLATAQEKWKLYKNSEVELAEKLEKAYFDQNPSILVYPQIVIEREMNIIKTRVADLINYYNLLKSK